MYVAPGLLYVHMPRTAGMFVTNVLDRSLGGTRTIAGSGVHDGVRRLPENVTGGRLSFGTVRDPWSWYVSFYSSFKQQKSGNITGPLAMLCGNQATFQAALPAMTRPTGAARLSSPQFPGHPKGAERLGTLLCDTGIGLWSWYVITSYCRDEVEKVKGLQARLEGADLPWAVSALVDAATVEEGLDKILEAWGGSKSEETRKYLETAPPVNESAPQWCWKGVRPSGRPDPRWWDPSMVATVFETDGWLLRRLGYDRPVGAREPIVVLDEG